MKAFICSLLGHRLTWILEPSSAVVTAVCRRCRQPILCQYPQLEPREHTEPNLEFPHGEFPHGEFPHGEFPHGEFPHGVATP